MTISRTAIDAPGAPAAIGPYSHAVRSGDLLFCSGQIALDPGSGELVGAGHPGVQAERCLRSLEAVCEAAGGRLADAVKLTVYLRDMSAFEEVNAVYAQFFEDAPPARVALAVAGLPRDVDVEIDAVVALSGP